MRPPNPPLAPAEITAALASHAGWSFENDALVREFKFLTFKDALAFMVRAGLEAEALNHHPEWTNVYNRISVRLTTHDAGNKVTAKDVELAKRMDKVGPA
jgi:4a-hydroxytetrahydrobiopterin dehydratase